MSAGYDYALTHARLRVERRGAFLDSVRRRLRGWHQESAKYAPFDSGTFFDQMRVEINRLAAELDPADTRGRRAWRKKVGPTVRAKVFLRDGYRCQECGWQRGPVGSNGKRSLTIDHVIPLAEGGSGRADNLRTVCSICNQAKGRKVPATSRVDSQPGNLA